MTPIYDGHTAVFGQNSAAQPTALAGNVLAKAVNKVFRGGCNDVRPPFWHLPWDITPEAESFELILRFGNFQGWMPYRKTQMGRQDGILISIGGSIFFLTLVNEKIQARSIMEGNDPKLMHTWFVQAREWAYIQNGKDLPIFWDGLSNARRSNPEADEMPIGTIMVYGHGRVFLTNAYDQIAASDIIYGGGLTTAAATQKFTENKYWAGGGYFGQPTDIGQITGAIVMPRLGTSLNGQGEVLFVSEEGASAIAAWIPRDQWQTSQVHAMTMNGRGCVAPDSLIAVNNDCWFRSDDGYSSYRLSKQEGETKWSLTKLSHQVNEWMRKDTDWLQRFNTATYFDNRIIGTTQPELSIPRYSEFGNHRYHRGMVVLDVEPPTGTPGDQEYNWDGLWTGMRPCSFIKLGKRCFAFSHDADGENRIYEVKKDGRNDRIDGKSVKTKWFYITKKYTWQSEFETKQLLCGDLWVSEVTDKVKIGIDYRADNSPCWLQAMKKTDFGNDMSGTLEFSHPRYDRLYMQSPKTDCQGGSRVPPDHGAVFQFMVYGEGAIRIDRLRAGVNQITDPTPMGGDCYKNNDKKRDKTCKLENDFEYNISDSR